MSNTKYTKEGGAGFSKWTPCNVLMKTFVKKDNKTLCINVQINEI